MLGFILCSMVKKTGVLTPEKRTHPPGGRAVFTSSPDPYHTKRQVLQRVKLRLQIYFKRTFFFLEVGKWKRLLLFLMDGKVKFSREDHYWHS
jgi:hypothetical protein